MHISRRAQREVVAAAAARRTQDEMRNVLQGQDVAPVTRVPAPPPVGSREHDDWLFAQNFGGIRGFIAEGRLVMVPEIRDARVVRPRDEDSSSDAPPPRRQRVIDVAAELDDGGSRSTTRWEFPDGEVIELED